MATLLRGSCVVAPSPPSAPVNKLSRPMDGRGPGREWREGDGSDGSRGSSAAPKAFDSVHHSVVPRAAATPTATARAPPALAPSVRPRTRAISLTLSICIIAQGRALHPLEPQVAPGITQRGVPAPCHAT